MTLQRMEQSLKLCWLCGSCFGRGPTEPHNWRVINPDPSPNERCPSYEYFKFRTYTAMDRNSLATLMHREDYPISDSLKKVIYSCVQCGVCSEICGLVDPVEINLAAREEVVSRSSLLPEHQRLWDIHAANGNPYGREAEQRGKWAQGLGLKDLGQEKADNLFFTGCSASLRPILRKSLKATATLFSRAGLDFGILGGNEACCGYIPRMLGDQEAFAQTMEANIAQLNGLGIKRLITSCPGCLQTFKAYPQDRLNFEVSHSLEVLDELVQAGDLTPGPLSVSCRVTYHDPCDLSRGCGVVEQPRNLLAAVPEAELAEMPRHGRWSYCCGSGACVDHILPDMVAYNAGQRLAEAQGTGADLLLTACPQCYMTLFKAAGKNQTGPRVEDIHVFLAESLQKPE